MVEKHLARKHHRERASSRGAGHARPGPVARVEKGPAEAREEGGAPSGAVEEVLSLLFDAASRSACLVCDCGGWMVGVTETHTIE